MNEPEITIGLVDDDPFALQALSAILNSTPKCSVTWAISTPAQTLESCRRNPVDLVLLDYLLGETTGDLICKQIIQQNPQQKVVVISSLEVADVARTALLAGARGFLSKADILKDLASFISVIMQESVVVSHAVAQGLFHAIPTPSQIALTKREQQVSELILQGMSNREIAEKNELLPVYGERNRNCAAGKNPHVLADGSGSRPGARRSGQLPENPSLSWGKLGDENSCCLLST